MKMLDNIELQMLSLMLGAALLLIVALRLLSYSKDPVVDLERKRREEWRFKVLEMMVTHRVGWTYTHDILSYYRAEDHESVLQALAELVDLGYVAYMDESWRYGNIPRRLFTVTNLGVDHVVQKMR